MSIGGSDALSLSYLTTGGCKGAIEAAVQMGDY
jgi:hypothetical protein